MKRDIVKEFDRLRTALLAERSTLERRLTDINALLGSTSSEAPVVTRERKVRAARRGRRRSQNALSLREAILQVTSKAPRTKEEILEGVKALGYKFVTARPINTLNAYLYKKGDYRRRNGRFEPVKAK